LHQIGRIREHGRKGGWSTSSASNVHEVGNDNSDPYKNMVMDAMKMNQGNGSQCPIAEEEPNADATRFFDLLKDSLQVHDETPRFRIPEN